MTSALSVWPCGSLRCAVCSNCASSSTQRRMRRRGSLLDAVLSAQLNEILHHPDFQRLEAAWGGLHYLVFHTPVSSDLKVRVLNVSKQDLRRDCVKATEFKQTVLFRKLEEEYGTPSGQPLTVLIGDYEFGPRPEYLEILETMAAIAAASQRHSLPRLARACSASNRSPS
jgi:type VI secretion system protein ImpC